MIDVVKSFGKLTKEHNGDYLTEQQIELRFSMGVDAINFGPELVQLETLTLLDWMTDTHIDEFYKICYVYQRRTRFYPLQQSFC